MATRDKYCTHENSANIIVSAPRRSPKNRRTSFRDISLHNSPHYLQTRKKYITACVCTEGEKTSHFKEFRSIWMWQTNRFNITNDRCVTSPTYQRRGFGQRRATQQTSWHRAPQTQNRPTQLNRICIFTAALLNKLTQERSYKKSLKRRQNAFCCVFKRIFA